MTKFYRPPQGQIQPGKFKNGPGTWLSHLFWSPGLCRLVRKDQPSREEAFDKLLPRIHPGAIVLLHSTSSTNAGILDELLTRWEKMGYEFGDLNDLVAEEG